MTTKPQKPAPVHAPRPTGKDVSARVYKVIDAKGTEFYAGLTWDEAWRRKEELAGQRKSTTPRVTLMTAASTAAPTKQATTEAGRKVQAWGEDDRRSAAAAAASAATAAAAAAALVAEPEASPDFIALVDSLGGQDAPEAAEGVDAIDGWKDDDLDNLIDEEMATPSAPEPRS